MTRRFDSREGENEGAPRAAWLTRPISRRAALAMSTCGLALGRWFRPNGANFRSVPMQLPGEHDGAEVARDRALRLLAVGDIGLPGATRDFVVRELATCMSARGADAVLLLGDNFYPLGVSSVQDEQWRSKFEELFPPETFSIPFHACLGNHDHKGDPRAQVEYTRLSARWHMPETYYTFDNALGADSRAQFFVLDTEQIWKGHAVDTIQLRWLEDELARSRARWKVAVGHHCIRSGGMHGQRGILGEMASRLEPLFERHGVDLYISGHDHDLQLLSTDAGWFQVVSGAGSALRPTGWTRDSLFAEAKPGFAALAIRPDELRIEFHAATEGLIHAHTIRKAVSGSAPRKEQQALHSG